MRAATLAFLSTGLAHARRDVRVEIIGRLLDAIDSAICAAEFAVIEVGDEGVSGNNVADCLVSLRDAAERVR